MGWKKEGLTSYWSTEGRGPSAACQPAGRLHRLPWCEVASPLKGGCWLKKTAAAMAEGLRESEGLAESSRVSLCPHSFFLCVFAIHSFIHS